MRTRLVLLIVACIVAGACSDDAEPELAAPTTTAVPISTYDVDEAMDGVREDVVRLVMERDGLDRAAAEVRADELMERGVDTEVVDQQFSLFANWMDNHQSHPVLGRHWTEDEAECAVVTDLVGDQTADEWRRFNNTNDADQVEYLGEQMLLINHKATTRNIHEGDNGRGKTPSGPSGKGAGPCSMSIPRSIRSRPPFSTLRTTAI